MVGVTGFEPAASTSQMSRAPNCATPRYVLFCFSGSGQISGQTRFGSDSNLLFSPFFTLFRRFPRLFIPEGRQRYLAPKQLTSAFLPRFCSVWAFLVHFQPIFRPISPLFPPVVFLVTVKYGVNTAVNTKMCLYLN